MWVKYLIILIISVFTVIFPRLVELFMSFLVMLHGWLINLLSIIFSDSFFGHFTRDLLGLFILPVVVGLILISVFWLVRRRFFPYTEFIVWSIWLLQLGALVVLHKI